MMVVWTEDRPGYPGKHFGIINGQKVSFNERYKSYGILPVVFTHPTPAASWTILFCECFGCCFSRLAHFYCDDRISALFAFWRYWYSFCYWSG